MSEIVDFMLEGGLCMACGSYIDDAGGDGIPRYCSRQCARDAGAEDLTSTRAERRAKRPPVRVAVASAAPSLSMRKRDVRWLALAADAGGCRWNKCVTAFMRLRKLGFVEDRSEPSGPQDQFSVVAHITPAGADALARALRVMGGAA